MPRNKDTLEIEPPAAPKADSGSGAGGAGGAKKGRKRKPPRSAIVDQKLSKAVRNGFTEVIFLRINK